jgi:hypothetical protein
MDSVSVKCLYVFFLNKLFSTLTLVACSIEIVYFLVYVFSCTLGYCTKAAVLLYVLFWLLQCDVAVT